MCIRDRGHHVAAKNIVSKHCPQFIEDLESVIGAVYTHSELDKKNEEYGYVSSDDMHPYNLIKHISKSIDKFCEAETSVDVTGTVLAEIKDVMPLSQTMSIYAMGALFSGKQA